MDIETLLKVYDEKKKAIDSGKLSKRREHLQRSKYDNRYKLGKIKKEKKQ